MAQSDIETEIAKLMDALEVSTNTELAAALGISVPAISQWRKRGSIPDRIMARVNAVVVDHGNRRELRDAYARLPVNSRHISRALALMYFARAKNGAVYDPEGCLRDALFLDTVERKSYELISEASEADGVALREAYLALAAKEDLVERFAVRLMPPVTARTMLG